MKDESAATNGEGVVMGQWVWLAAFSRLQNTKYKFQYFSK